MNELTSVHCSKRQSQDSDRCLLQVTTLESGEWAGRTKGNLSSKAGTLLKTLPVPDL